MTPFRFAAAAMILVEAVSASMQVDVIVLSHDDNSLHLVDPTLGSVQIGQIPVGMDLVELVWADEDSLYVIDRITDELLTIHACDASLESAVALDVDLPTSPRGFDVDAAGVLHAVTQGLELRTVNTATGVTTWIATLSGVGQVESLTFSPTGELYASGAPNAAAESRWLYTIDLGTGVATQVGFIGINDIDTMTWGSDGFLYASESNDGLPGLVFRIDPSTASILPLGVTTVTGITGIAARGPVADANLNGLADECESIAFNYCSSTPNSTGRTARLSVLGSATVSDNDLVLVGDRLPPHEFAFFLMGTNPGAVMIGPGVLCMAVPIVRLDVGAGSILNSGPGGVISRPLDLTSLPQSTTIQPGDTWRFQVWHRDFDLGGGGPTMNFSEAVQVSFQ